MKAFYIFKREKRKNYYVQFIDPITGKLKSAVSTGKSNYQEALEHANTMLQKSLIDNKKANLMQSIEGAVQNQEFSFEDRLKVCSILGFSNQPILIYGSNKFEQKKTYSATEELPLIQWLYNFWNYKTSDSVQDKLSHGKRISKRYCNDQTTIINHWIEFFGTRIKVHEVKPENLQEFEKFLWKKKIYKRVTVEDKITGKKSVKIITKKLSTTTRNNIIKCASIAFEWCIKKKLLSDNPCKALTAYRIIAKKRGILNRKEVNILFNTGMWKDERARVASLVAMTTGLRMSEILALRVDDIGDDRLYISHSWNVLDGLSTTKNGESRIVPLIPKVKSELEKLYWSNPHKKSGSKFIFFGTLPHKPVVQNVITDGFKFALESIGISETQRQERNIVFHSWRHFYATTIATELSEKHAQLTLGHLTQAMTKHYADHKTEEALMSVCTASNDIFREMIG